MHAEAGRDPPSANFGPSHMVGSSSMLEQSVCRERSVPAESLRCVQRTNSIPEPQSNMTRMVALICHDLRLPLTAILANAEFLSQSGSSEAEKDEFYQEICEAIERMNELVTSLMDYSRDRDFLQPAVGDVVDTIERAIRMIRTKQEFRHISIRHLHKGQNLGWYDSSRFERVVTNLVLNACEAVHPDEGKILVTTIGSRSCLELSVWDNGPGISSVIKDSIFEPFVSHGKARGSGLGLTIAKKIVEDHGGAIQLDGANETGTLFRITIPFASPRGRNSELCLAELPN
jgi:signal transduction histidine kinase